MSRKEAFYIILGLAFLLFFASFVTLKLLAKPNAARRIPFASQTQGIGEPTPIDLSNEGDNVYAVQLTIAPEDSIRHAQNIAFPVATYQTRPRILWAELRNADGQCLARGAGDSVHEDNADVILEAANCSRPGLWTTKLTLLLKASAPSRLALWGSRGPAEKIVNAMLAGDNFFIQGYYEILQSRNLRRVDLLNVMWGWRNSPPIGLLTSITLFIFLLLILLLRLTRLQTHIWMTYFAFLLFSTLGCLYAYITPPLQAPDEPDHLLSYLHSTTEVKSSEEFLTFAQANHFERIKFHASERFTESDVDSPLLVPFAGHIEDSEIPKRSPLLTVMWLVVHPILENLDVGTQIFALRMLNVSTAGLIFALTSFLIFSCYKDSSLPLYLCLSWILISCACTILFFFVMYVSDYSLTLAFGFLGAALLFKCLHGWQESPIVYCLMLGGCLMGMVMSSSSGASYLGLWIVFLALFPVFSSKSDPERRKLSKIPGFLCFCILLFSATMPFWVSKAWLQNRQYVLIGSAIGIPLSIYLQIGFAPIFSSKTAIAIQRLLHGILGILLTASLVFPVFLESRSLPNIENTTDFVSPFRYAIQALKIMMLNLGLGPVDFYISSSFWGGIGWLESDFDNWFVVSVRTFFTIGIIIRLFLTHSENNSRYITFNLAVLCGTAAMLLGSAFVISRDLINFHGRYLIPFYVTLIAFSAYGYMQLLEKFDSYRIGITFVTGLLFLSLAHAYSVSFILNRYFG